MNSYPHSFVDIFLLFFLKNHVNTPSKIPARPLLVFFGAKEVKKGLPEFLSQFSEKANLYLYLSSVIADLFHNLKQLT